MKNETSGFIIAHKLSGREAVRANSDDFNLTLTHSYHHVGEMNVISSLLGLES
ncbi:MAG: hypothetical protein PVF83_03605 [Anaerolineales bacterium]